MKIIFIWTGITGYMADCWRELAKSVRVKIYISELVSPEREFAAGRVLRDLDCTVLDAAKKFDGARVAEQIRAFSPDVIAIVGWHDPLCRFVATCPALKQVPKVIMFDLPFVLKLRRLLAPIVLHRYLKWFAGAFVCGARAVRYAKWLGFEKVTPGLFSFNVEGFKDVWRRRLETPHGQRFVYVGRYATTKRLDVMMAAYRRYRTMVRDPWPLDCYGAGAGVRWLTGVAGVKDCGFVQPEQLPEVLAAHDVFVITSDDEPWCVAIGEACAAGMPVICTRACGAGDELIHEGVNGIICRTNQVEDIARAMVWMTEHEDRLAELGRTGIESVKPYSCAAWSERVKKLVRELAVESPERESRV